MTSYNSTWLTPSLLQTLAYPLSKYKIVPRGLLQHSIDQASYDDFHLLKMLPDGHQITYHEKGLLCREVSFIKNRINLFQHQKINVFDLWDTNGETTLPFISDLIESNALGKYVPITANGVMNQHAIQNLRKFSLLAGYPNFKYDQITVDIEQQSFRPLIREVVREEEGDFANLFLLMESCLGNFVNPGLVLKNIFDSMERGDYLAILQGIHNPGNEDRLVYDYRHLSTVMADTHFISGLLNPNYNLIVDWDDQPSLHGLKMTIKIDQPVTIASVTLATDDIIEVFRSSRHEDNNLRKIFREVGFQLVDVAYDESMDHALYFCSK